MESSHATPDARGPVQEELVDRSDPLSAEAVLDELEAVLSSRHFRSAPRLSGFLRFVVERTLAGGSDGLKEYTIATEALGRPQSFDPRMDTLVRVSAGRLRRRLSEHYENADPARSISIELPKGSYAPRFRRIPHPPNRGERAATVERQNAGSRKRAFLFAAYVLTAVACFALLQGDYPSAGPPEQDPCRSAALFSPDGHRDVVRLGRVTRTPVIAVVPALEGAPGRRLDASAPICPTGGPARGVDASVVRRR